LRHDSCGSRCLGGRGNNGLLRPRLLARLDTGQFRIRTQLLLRLLLDKEDTEDRAYGPSQDYSEEPAHREPLPDQHAI
jgi:hypothetical protein